MKYLPGFGQLLWALEYPFLERKNFQKDKETIADVAKVYKSFPFPIQVSTLYSIYGIDSVTKPLSILRVANTNVVSES